MQHYSETRRHLACWLAICFLAQIVWLGLGPVAGQSTAHLSRHQTVRTQRTGSWSGTRGLQPAPVANHLASWQPGIPEACFDFYLQWNISLLTKRQISSLGLLPADTARFGRAPPSIVL